MKALSHRYVLISKYSKSTYKMSGTHIFRKVIPIIRVKLITPHLRSALVITPSMSLLGDITVQFPGGTSRAGGGQCAWLYSSCCSNTTCWCGGVLFAEETKTKRNPCCSTAFQRVDEVVLSHHAKNQASEIQRIAKTWCNLNFTQDFWNWLSGVVDRSWGYISTWVLEFTSTTTTSLL